MEALSLSPVRLAWILSGWAAFFLAQYALSRSFAAKGLARTSLEVAGLFLHLVAIALTACAAL